MVAPSRARNEREKMRNDPKTEADVTPIYDLFKPDARPLENAEDGERDEFIARCAEAGGDILGAE